MNTRINTNITPRPPVRARPSLRRGWHGNSGRRGRIHRDRHKQRVRTPPPHAPAYPLGMPAARPCPPSAGPPRAPPWQQEQTPCLLASLCRASSSVAWLRCPGGAHLSTRRSGPPCGCRIPEHVPERAALIVAPPYPAAHRFVAHCCAQSAEHTPTVNTNIPKFRAREEHQGLRPRFAIMF